MARTLDRTKPYGEIFQAEEHDGRHYEQNGIYFDATGKEWVPPVAAMLNPDTPSADLAAHPAVQEIVAAAVAAALATGQAKADTPAKAKAQADKNLAG